MAMTFGSSEDEAQTMSSINTTPLVDVMLVLLIIFLITVPVITKTVKVDLPKAVNIPTVTKPENITVAVDAAGNVYWNDGKLSGKDALLERIKSVAVLQPQPEIHIRADKNTRWENVGRVIYNIQRGGVVKVSFVTEPDRGVRGFR
ncbi:MAG: biopolymer transporter ExbD [Pseudomonadales bacterium]|nr:biopolymer transporter ExbD [Pseudomonadales bacterium]